MAPPTPLSLDRLRSCYQTPEDLQGLLTELSHRAASGPPAVFTYREPLQAQLDALRRADQRRRQAAHLPLFGIPFAVKDNIDVAGVPTTAGCPAFAYTPERSCPVVDRLLDAGAIFVGKTNLDQFATGLSGVRSPYGVCENPFDARFIAGGSSSGSGVAVATGICCFALGTDTAGSGRVPAALNNIVGLKPTRGALSTRGVVPACRTLDCLSIFAASCADARQVFDCCEHYDARDPFARQLEFATPGQLPPGPRIGIPATSELEFHGDGDAARLYQAAVEHQRALGAVIVEIDVRPFLATADLLYRGPWVAERLHAAGELLSKNPGALEPTVRAILEAARTHSALDAFRGRYRLAELARQATREWQRMDMLLLPTTPSTWTIAELKADPLELNTRLGYYTNFVNLLDLAALAVPAGFRSDGLPLGVTFMGPRGSDRNLLEWGIRSARGSFA